MANKSNVRFIRMFDTHLPGRIPAISSKSDILNAATEAFADRGFDAASVRAICTAAGVNLAAINYHFGGKAALYREVVTRAYESSRSTPMPSLADHDSPDEALAGWIDWYVGRSVQAGLDPARRLLLREAAQPTTELDGVVQSVLHPVYQALEEIVKALLPCDIDARSLKLHCLGILGQCMVHRVCREMIDRLPVEPHIGPEDAMAISELITMNARASLAAARAINTEDSSA
ncbi:MAG: hypothetical protein CMJ67_06405 [Planctomycetaceae bacterium]|nr:hypothetical protein [Planctomycetaceae bacterium]